VSTTLEKTRYSFWSEFLKQNKSNTILFKCNPTDKMMQKHYISIPIHGNSKIHFTFALFDKYHYIELTIQDNKDESSRVFEHILRQKDLIEDQLGENLRWDGSKGLRKRCKIMSKKYEFGHENLDKYNVIYKNFIDKMSAFSKIILPLLDF